MFDGSCCPKCKTKVRRPWYKCGWLWFILALIVVIIACCSDSEDDANHSMDTDSLAHHQTYASELDFGNGCMKIDYGKFM